MNAKYDLTKFSTVHATSIDHIDPSIYCVLTAKSKDPSTALVDFLKLGPRWDVAMNTFRQPYFHRNAATEYSAMIWGGAPGGASGTSDGGAWVEVGHTPHGNLSEDSVAEMNNLINEPRIILQGKCQRGRYFSLLTLDLRCAWLHGRDQPILDAFDVCKDWAIRVPSAK